MITDRIGRHEVLLPINHNFNKICDIIGYFLNQNTRNSKFCFASSEKKSHLSARVMARTVLLNCPIRLKSGHYDQAGLTLCSHYADSQIYAGTEIIPDRDSAHTFCFGASSVTKRSCAAPYSKVEC